MTNSNNNLVYRQPIESECEGLWRLAIHSKKHWGYDDEFIQSCREELKVSPDKLNSPEYSYKLADLNGAIIGFYCLERLEDAVMEVEALFVSPEHIGKGVGSKLWEHLCNDAKAMQATKLVIASDPFAEPFYQRMGAIKVGEVASGSVPGRTLPFMMCQL